jgi:UDP-N-acetyl-D-glucosamine dehydrogenase
MQLSVLRAAIEDRKVMVSVLGQGYVGLPLALSFCEVGFDTFGIDVDPHKVAALAAGQSYILDVHSQEVEKHLKAGRYHPTMDFSVIARSDVAIICVPTPLRKTKDPDVSYIVDAVDRIREHMHKGLLIVLESTTYPGTTDELIVNVIERTGYRIGKDFFVCFSPERVDPGNATYRTTNMPKVIGGSTRACSELGQLLYRKVMTDVVLVSSARAAEMVKLLENTFRAVNIGLVNEMCLMCERMGIDIWEVIDAAATKPFGFMPFYPGPGIGGHCIPLDPMYLSWKAKSFGFYNRFIEIAGDINGSMPQHVVGRVVDVLNLEGKALLGSRILCLGVAYKKDVNDVRESPSLDVIELLGRKGAAVEYNDPYVHSYSHANVSRESIALTPDGVASFDCVVLLTNHSCFDYQMIAERAKVVVDTRNAFRGVRRPNIFLIGTQFPTVAEWQNVKRQMAKAAASRS